MHISRPVAPHINTINTSPAHEWVQLIFGLIILAAVVLTIIYVARLVSRNPRVQGDLRDPLEIACVRFARGEITKSEFADIKKELVAK